MPKLVESIEKLKKHHNLSDIGHCKLVGLEKESLRIKHDGQLANSPHPSVLGSTLTHPFITTDYAESQLELITSPHYKISDMLDEMTDLHAFIYQQISNSSLMWPNSIPGMLPPAKEILTAHYGTSVKAQFKEIYRSGLGYRYGKNMQLMCGIHFNFSFTENFWKIFFSSFYDQNSYDQADVNSVYMSILRNYHRISWIITYLFGASPVINSKFINQDTAVANYLKKHNDLQYIAPFGTSIRESNLGYSNKNNLLSLISYDDLDNYVQCIEKAVSTPDPNFVEIGKYRYGKKIQLNCNILQIENEYYNVIRPKPHKIEQIARPNKLLKDHGIAYIELRNLDLNPFSPIGIDKTQCYFMELLIYYCCLCDSPYITPSEYATIRSNRNKVALLGRQPDLQLQKDGSTINLTTWVSNIFNDLFIIAQLLDQAEHSNNYSHALNILNSSDTLSTKIFAEINNPKLGYFDYFLNIAKKHKEFYDAYHLSDEKACYFAGLAEKSLYDTKKLEDDDLTNKRDIDDYAGILFDN